MSGMAGDNHSSYEEEATDPVTRTLHNPSQSYADHTKESGSSVAEKIAEAMQPGSYLLSRGEALPDGALILVSCRR
ncbi:hypothetical protein CNMCM8057_004803 [Aspergillus fumigatus]|nr:hypothetical protein CNMCM8057_004803 [Aspergillus fumigatus]